MRKNLKKFGWWGAVLGLALAIVTVPIRATAQDQGDDQDDPPSRVARLGYMQGSVSIQPAGEDDWVGAVSNRPMTTGDKLWSDQGSRAELQLGSAVIRLSENTGISFLNLDDNTVQVQLSSGSINVRLRQLDDNDSFEVDTPNLAFTLSQPGSYRVEASQDGTYSVVTIRDGEGEATGNGQTYTLHAGQRTTFNGTDSLNADVEQIGDPDQFDNWAYNRDHRHDESASARYVSHDVVGYDDLDDNGDWRDDSNYGHVWYPRVDAGWAPYHNGHWDWIAPWGWTWVDDASWGYAPFHYGRWVSVGGRWGWIAGPVAVRAVYAPALVVFIGGGPGGFGGNVGWFPLGPREVYVPSYHVSERYVNRVNVSNTTVNVTQVTNVYNTTIVRNNTTNITNVTYANRNVQGAVMAVPQRTFVSAQPVSQARVQVNARDIAAAPVNRRVAVNPTRESVLGARAGTANRVTAPPAAVMNRQVIAKKTPPPPPVPFAKQQQAMAANPGQPLPKRELANLRPAAAAAHPTVKVAPPGKPATPTMGRPNQPNAGRPGQPAPAAPALTAPANRPGNQPTPNERPGATNQPNRPPAVQPNNPPNNQPANRPPAAEPNNRPENRPEMNRPPAEQPSNRPNNNRPEPNQPNNRPGQPNNRPETNQPNNQPPNRPPAAEPNNRPENRPEMNRPPAAQPGNQPNNNRPEPNQPNNRPGQPNNRPETNQPNNQPPNRPPAEQPNSRPENRPEMNRPPAAQPNNRPEPNQPNRPTPPPPARNDRPPAAQPNNRPEPNRNEPPARPQAPPPQAQRPPQEHTPPPAARPAPPPPKPKPEEKKKEDQKKPPQ